MSQQSLIRKKHREENVAERRKYRDRNRRICKRAGKAVNTQKFEKQTSGSLKNKIQEVSKQTSGV